MRLVRRDGKMVWQPDNIREEHDWLPVKTNDKSEAWLLPITNKHGQPLIISLPSIESTKK
jgi:hypothetical protein